MFRFESAEYLWIMGIIPLLVLVWWWNHNAQEKRMKLLGDLDLVKLLSPEVSTIRRKWKFILRLGAIAMLVFMLARPQMGMKTGKEKRSGIECVVALDVSNSMMAQDVSPNRLERSKMLVENILDRFSDDRIGLVVFAGDAFVQLPITNDYVSAKMFLKDIDPSMIQTQGTDLAQAVRLSLKSFSKQSGVGRAIILITDGEDHEGGAEEAAEEAKKAGVNLYVLGVGSTAGSPIPMENGGYMQDGSGETVVSALNEEMCKKMARAGNGIYLHVDNASAAQERLNAELEKLQKGDAVNVIYSEYDEQFQAFGLLAIFLLLLDVLVRENRNPLLRFNIFGKR